MIITGTAIYLFIKFWLPILSAVALAGKLFLVIRKAVVNTKNEIGNWANTLLDNHAVHIQAACESSAASLKTMAETNQHFATAITEMRGDFQVSQVETLRVQNAILTGIEVIKAKVN